MIFKFQITDDSTFFPSSIILYIMPWPDMDLECKTCISPHTISIFVVCNIITKTNMAENDFLLESWPGHYIEESWPGHYIEGSWPGHYIEESWPKHYIEESWPGHYIEES
jgi:hypothetical protein